VDRSRHFAGISRCLGLRSGVDETVRRAGNLINRVADDYGANRLRTRAEFLAAEAALTEGLALLDPVVGTDGVDRGLVHAAAQAKHLLGEIT
jgi:hypothetical protein